VKITLVNNDTLERDKRMNNWKRERETGAGAAGVFFIDKDVFDRGSGRRKHGGHVKRGRRIREKKAKTTGDRGNLQDFSPLRQISETLKRGV